MKSNAMKLAVISMIALAISQASFGQLTEDTFLPARLIEDHEIKITIGVHDRREAPQIPAVAMRHLEKNFSDYSFLNWYIYDEGIVARFESDKLSHMSLYGIDGLWKHTITYYPPEKLSEQTIQVIKKRYPDYEVQRGWHAHIKNAKPRVIVQIENELEMKELAVLGKKLVTLKALQLE